MRSALFVRINKIDEATQSVSGTATQEVPDRDGEIFDYDGSKPYVEKWSDYFKQQTGGKSLGNLRAMHRPISAGVLTDVSFNDLAKSIDVTAKINDPVEWQKVMDGNYTGFSFSGKVVKRWRDPENRSLMRYIANPTELSLADMPAVPTATFKFAKADGSIEERTFKVAARADTTAAEGESKYGDVDYADAKNKKYPIDTKAHVRAALSYWGQAKNRAKYAAKDQASIGRKIRAAARKFGIDVTEKAMLAGDFQKGLYDIGQLANALQSIAWLEESARMERDYEGDESDVPDKLFDAVETLTEVLEEMTGEECAELLARIRPTVDDETDDTNKITEATTMNDADFRKALLDALQSPDTFAKALAEPEFAKLFAKKHIAKVAELKDTAADVHKAMGVVHKAMGAYCAKVDGLHGEMTKDDEPADDAAKVALAEATKLAAGSADAASFAKTVQGFETRLKAAEDRAATAETERDEFKKSAEDLATAGETLAKSIRALGDGKGILKVVGKSEDSGTGAMIAKTAADEEPKTAKDAFKKSFGNPEIVTGLPGQRKAATA